MENKISQEELNKRINWTLNQKIDHSLYIIESFMHQYPNSYVSFSGGIDSTIMLFLVRMLDKNKKGIFVNTTNEHSEILKFVKTVENIDILLPKITFSKVVEQYGFPLISKKIARMINTIRHPTGNNEALINLYMTGVNKNGGRSNDFYLPKKYRFLLNAPFELTDKCCNYLKKLPLSKFNNQGTFIGIKATDSRLRRFYYLKTSCINLNQHKAMPLSIWTKQDIWKFQKQNKIEYCEVYDKGEESTGCAYCGFGCQFDKNRFLRLREREPKRYQQMMNLTNNGITYAEALKIALNMNIDDIYIPAFFQNIH